MDHRYRKFYEVAQLKSFSAAARSLSKSQPAITLAIGSLERSLGVKLFNRNRYDVSLTNEGKIVFDSAKKIIKEDQLLQQKLANLAQDTTRQVGIIDSIAHLLYSSPQSTELLSGLKIMVDNSRKIINSLSAEKIDIGLITGQPGPIARDIRIKRLHNEKFVFVRSPKLKTKSINAGIDDWLAFNADSTTYVHFTKMFKQLYLDIQPKFFSTSLDLLKDMAISGRGTALLPFHMVRDDITAGKLAKIKSPTLTRPIWAIVRKKNKSGLEDISRQVDKLLASSSTLRLR